MQTHTGISTGWGSMLRVSLPISLGIFVQFIVVFIDNFFVAQIDGVAMSAVAFIGLIYLALSMLGVGAGNAAQILIARRLGERRKEEVPLILGNALWLGVCIGIMQVLIMWLLLPPLLDATVESGPLRDYMMVFAKWRALGFLFYTPTVILNSYWSGVANTRVLAYGTLITSGFTILLDYLLIFGHGGFPALGVEGAAIATMCAEGVAMLFIALYSFRHAYASAEQDDRKLFNRKVFQWSRAHTLPLTKLGFPISLQLLASLGIWIVFYGFIEDMGEQDLQSAFIVRNMYMLCYVSVGGISTATKTYVSALIAEGRQSELLRTMFRLMALNFLGIALLSHGLWCYPEWIAGQFTQDPGVVQRTIDSMLVVLPAMLGFSVTGVMLATVEGCGATLRGFVIEATTGLLYIIAAWWMVHRAHWPIHYVWASDYVYFFFLGFFSLLFLFNGRWKYRQI